MCNGFQCGTIWMIRDLNYLEEKENIWEARKFQIIER